MAEDVPNRQEIVHYASHAVAWLALGQQTGGDRKEIRFQIGVAVQEELVRRQRLLELERLVCGSAKRTERTLRLHDDQNLEDLLQRGEALLRAVADDVEDGVQLVEQRGGPRTRHHLVHI